MPPDDQHALPLSKYLRNWAAACLAQWRARCCGLPNAGRATPHLASQSVTLGLLAHRNATRYPRLLAGRQQPNIPTQTSKPVSSACLRQTTSCHRKMGQCPATTSNYNQPLRTRFGMGSTPTGAKLDLQSPCVTNHVTSPSPDEKAKRGNTLYTHTGRKAAAHLIPARYSAHCDESETDKPNTHRIPAYTRPPAA